ncbi:MAG: formylglycine-generating enzyme family protein [Thermodesulfobacteriota bacterium]
MKIDFSAAFLRFRLPGRLLRALPALLLLLHCAAPAFSWSTGENIGPMLDWVRVPDAKTQVPDPPNRKIGDTWTDPVTGMEFVWIPGGCFMMGTPETEKERYEDESPLHQVCVNGFWMGKYEVTNAQYRKFKPDHTSKEYDGIDLNGDNQPVVYISWVNAMDFALWLTEQSDGKYLFWLPTEAENEYACRAGTSTVRFWGDDPAQAIKYANVADEAAKGKYPKWGVHPGNDGFVVTAPVGSFAPNPWGLYDMLGNVWEWCQDWKGPYPDTAGPLVNPTGPSSSKEGRIVRGGSWDNDPRGVRSGNRSYGTDNFKRYNDGFRLVRLR